MPDTPLLWILRNNLDLTGTKYGCGIGACGACTIHQSGKAVRACQITISDAAGKSFTTIEGLSKDGDHPCQRAWIEEDVSQCGYCQPGMIMTAAALIKEHPDPTNEDIDRTMSDSVCRCGTYGRIRRAINCAAGVENFVGSTEPDVTLHERNGAQQPDGASTKTENNALRMPREIKISRRHFLNSGAIAASGLFLAFHLASKSYTVLTAAEQNAKAFAPNALLSIGSDNRVTIWVTKSEMGQGVRTALPMMLADELEADWSQLELKQASPGPAFKGIRLKTSGSGSIAGTWEPYRKAGAIAREMLIAAAAQTWNVSTQACRAEKGTVLHISSGRRLNYGELAERAAKLPVPANPELKSAKDFRFIGLPKKRVDGADIVSGKAIYGFDVKVPGMRYAVVKRAPFFNGKPVRWDDTQTKKIPGVLAVIGVTKGIAGGVAVIAEDIWAAMKGREALEVTWGGGGKQDFNSDAFTVQLRSALDTDGFTTRKEGEVETSFAKATTKLEAIYEYPFQAHAPIETMNCIAAVGRDGCEIWSSTQAPELAQEEAAKMLNLKADAVKVNVPLLGGGFGRRLQVDYVLEAVEISKAIKAPVQVVWSRVDDMKYGFFHPATVCKMNAGIDTGKKLTVFTHKTATSDLSVLGPPMLDIKKYRDIWMPWGGYDNPYLFPAYRADYIPIDSPVPTGPWRSVFYPGNVFARESFIDEIAAATGKDPLALRLELLDAPTVELGTLRIERRDLRRVLEVVATKSGWNGPLPQEKGKRWGRGIACNVYHGESLIAQVAEVSVEDNGNFKVERVVCVVDCGQVVNPLGLEGQIEGGIVWGLSAALHGQITFRAAQAEQNSFRDFKVLRMNEMPQVEIYTIPRNSRPFGIGEVPVPPVAPAVANALFAATGKRVRSLPITPDKLT